MVGSQWLLISERGGLRDNPSKHYVKHCLEQWSSKHMQVFLLQSLGESLVSMLSIYIEYLYIDEEEISCQPQPLQVFNRSSSWATRWDKAGRCLSARAVEEFSCRLSGNRRCLHRETKGALGCSDVSVEGREESEGQCSTVLLQKNERNRNEREEGADKPRWNSDWRSESEKLQKLSWGMS